MLPSQTCLGAGMTLGIPCTLYGRAHTVQELKLSMKHYVGLKPGYGSVTASVLNFAQNEYVSNVIAAPQYSVYYKLGGTK